MRPVGWRALKEISAAVEQSSGQDRLNIYGVIDLKTGQTIMKDVLTVDVAIETVCHVFLGNARYAVN